MRRRSSASFDRLEARQLLTDIFVSTAGNNANGGTIASPVRTIQYAADLAQADDTVFIRAGTYRETVTPPRSGTAAARITFRSYNGEDVTVSGADTLSSWTQAPGSEVYFTSMTWNYASDFQSNQVFADGKMLNLARWPTEMRDDLIVNPYEASVDSVIQNPSNTSQLIIADAEFTEPAARWVGAKIWVNLSRGGADGQGQTGTVVAVNGSQLTVSGIDNRLGDQPWGVGLGTKYYLFDPARTALNGTGGIAAGVDRGEWYLDTTQNRLFVHTRDGSAPQNIEAKRRSYAFNLDSRSYITVKDLSLFGTSLTTDNLAANRNVNPGGIAPASNLNFDGLTATYITHFTDQAGNYQMQWPQKSGLILSGSDITLRNSRLRYSAGPALSIMGTRAQVVNNAITDANYLVTNAGAVTFGKTYDPGPGAIISTDHSFGYNTIYNTPGRGIDINALKNSTNDINDIRARIHHNVIHDVMQRSFDSGAIDTVVSNGQYVRIDHNVIYNMRGNGLHGVYLDFAYKYVIDHNVIHDLNQPILVNWYTGWAGASTPASQDVFVFNNTAIAAKVSESGIGNAFGSQNPGVVIRNNIVSKASNPSANWTVSNERVAASSMFVDAANRDYRLASSAVSAIDQGVSVAPFDDLIVGGSPDIGAYEFGGSTWSAGSSLLPGNDLSPTALTGVRRTGGVVRLTWTDNATNERGYVVERSKDFNAWSVVATLPPNSTLFDDTVPSNGTWFYRVRTFDSSPSRVESVNVPRSAYAVTQAEDNDIASGVYNEAGPPIRVAGFDAGDYLGYYGLDFGTGGANRIGLRLAVPDTGSRRVDIRLDSLTGTVIGSFFPTGTGSWSTFVEQFGNVALTTGIHDVYLIGVNGNGIFNLDSLRFLPSAPSAPQLLPSSDTGTSDVDRITADTTPTFFGDAADGATVELLDGAVVVGSTIAVNGQWSITSSARPDGVHVFAVRAVGGGVSGNTFSATTSVTIDSTSPAASSITYLFDASRPTIEIVLSENIVDASGLLSALDLQNTTLAAAVPASALGITYDAANRRALITFNALPANGNYTLGLPAGAVGDLAGNVNLAATGSFFNLAGDANRDHSVNFSDLVILAQNYSSNGRSFSGGNFNYDAAGNVDFSDLVILAQNYGINLSVQQTQLAPATTPTIRNRRLTVIN